MDGWIRKNRLRPRPRPRTERQTDRQTDKREKKVFRPPNEPAIHPAIRPGCVCVYVWKSREQRATYIHTYIQARPYQRTSVRAQIKSDRRSLLFSFLLSYSLLYTGTARDGYHSLQGTAGPLALLLNFPRKKKRGGGCQMKTWRVAFFSGSS